jgi:hypothetical protein
VAAGWEGNRELFFDCADCEVKEPEIAGCLSEDGTYRGVGIIQKLGLRYFPALFCGECWKRRIGHEPTD